MKLIFELSAVALLSGALLSGCAGERDEQRALAEMDLQIDQLTNAVGRLEFRVAQLEDQLGAASALEPPMTPGDSAETLAPSNDQEDTGSSDKRYDLAPVE